MFSHPSIQGSICGDGKAVCEGTEVRSPRVKQLSVSSIYLRTNKKYEKWEETRV